MKKKKLSHIEVEAAVNGIRKKYNDLIVEYMKPKVIKNSFEDRYIGALRARVDMGNFIYTEIMVVGNLIKKEKEKLQQLEIKKEKRLKVVKSDKNISIADRVFDANRDKIRNQRRKAGFLEGQSKWKTNTNRSRITERISEDQRCNLRKSADYLLQAVLLTFAKGPVKFTKMIRRPKKEGRNENRLSHAR